MLFNVYTNNELHEAKNLNNYFHEIFKWNLDIWSMFLVLNNLYSNTDQSKKVKSIAKNFFELSLVKRINHEKINFHLDLTPISHNYFTMKCVVARGENNQSDLRSSRVNFRVIVNVCHKVSYC